MPSSIAPTPSPKPTAAPKNTGQAASDSTPAASTPPPKGTAGTPPSAFTVTDDAADSRRHTKKTEPAAAPAAVAGSKDTINDDIRGGLKLAFPGLKGKAFDDMFRLVKDDPKATQHYKSIDDYLGDRVYNGKPPNLGAAGTSEYKIKAGLRAAYAEDPRNKLPNPLSPPKDIIAYQTRRNTWVDAKYNEIKDKPKAAEPFIAKHEKEAQGLEEFRKAQGIPTVTDIIPNYWQTGIPKDYKASSAQTKITNSKI